MTAVFINAVATWVALFIGIFIAFGLWKGEHRRRLAGVFRQMPWQTVFVFCLIWTVMFGVLCLADLVLAAG